MKLFLTHLFIFFFSTFLFATTFHTITIDGTNDFSADETFSTTSTGYTAYITWDQNSLYIGYDGPDINSNDGNKWVLVYIDTDPQQTPTAGTGSTVGQLYNTQQPNLPFTANYHLRWKADNSYTNMEKWNGSSWDPGIGAGYWTGSAYQSGNFVEISIPLTDLGNPTQIYICTVMINEVGSGEWTYAGNPNDIFTDGYDPDYLHYYGFNLVSGISPNQAQYHDKSLPVTLSSFTAFSSQNSVILQWIAQSEVNVVGYEIQRSLDQYGSFQTIASYLTHAELKGRGNSSARTIYQFEDQNINSNHTYWYKLISHDLDGSKQTFGPISVTTQTDDNNLEQSAGNIPQKFNLYQNFPNPFNNSTEIPFDLPQVSDGTINVQLSIYDLNGRLIKTLVNEALPSGSYQLRWDGKNQNGAIVPTGIYIYQLITPKFIQSKKMLLVQ